MLSDADRNKAADILMEAEKTRKQAVQLSTTYPGITIEDAYAISTMCANRKIKAGRKLVGHKVGLTSKAMQRSSNIDEPDFGYLLDDMIVPDGAKVQHANYCKPRVEVELAFVLGKRLMGPGIGLTDVLAATEYVVPAHRDRRCARAGPAQDLRHRGRQRRGRRHRDGRPPGPADGRRSALGRRHHVPQLGDRGDRRRRRRARPSGDGRGLARQQGRRARHAAGAGPHRAGGLVHPRGVRAEGRHACTPISVRSAASPCSSSERVGDPAWTCRATRSSTPSPRANCRSACGAACATPSPSEIVSHSGFDWLLLDTEHSPNEVPDILAQLQAVQAGTASASCGRPGTTWC